MRSLAGRVALAYALLMVIFLGGAGWYLTAAAERFALQSLTDQLAGQAGAMAAGALPHLQGGRDPTLLALYAVEMAATVGARVTIVDAAGKVLGDSHRDPLTMESHADRPEIRQALAGGRGSAIRSSSTLGERMLYVAVPVGDPARPAGAARVAWSLARVDGWLGDLRRSFLLGTLVLLGLGVGVSVAVARWVGRPLRELGALARAMAAGDMTGRVFVRAPRDVAEIGAALNELASRLRVSISELDRQRQELAALLEQMADGVVVVDPGGCPVRSNAAARRLLGAGLVTPRVRVTELLPRPEVRRALEACLGGQREEVILQHGEFLLRLVMTPLERGCLVLVQDLTPVRRLETMRRDFVANLSHEIRTPLSVIKALAETLERTEDAREARPFLVQLTGQVDRLALLTRRLAELARLESGQPDLHLQDCDLGEIAGSALAGLAPVASRRGVAMELDAPAGLPAVRGDPDLLRELFENLLDNALKFTPAGGRVTVSARAEGDRVLVRVRDTGQGIPAADLPRVFERFYKGQARLGTGTGLGLAICKHIVLAHGGEIWAESKPDQGSTFSFALPVGGPPATSRSGP